MDVRAMAFRTINISGVTGRRIMARRWVTSIAANAAGAITVQLERGWVFRDTGKTSKQFVGLVAALDLSSVLFVERTAILFAEARVLNKGGSHILEVRRSNSNKFVGVDSFASRNAAVQVARDEYFCEVPE